MTIFLYIIIATTLESLVALIGILFIFIGYDRFKRYLPYLLSFSTGTFLAVVFFDLIPEAVEGVGVEIASFYILFGFIFFFILSRFLHWYHHHEGDCAKSECKQTEIDETRNFKTSGYLVLFGDFIHNFVDGIIIALAFMVDINIGVVTTIAVLFHEFPQEASDFFVMINSGFSKTKALIMNFFVSLSTIVGAMVTYFIAKDIDMIIAPALGIVAGNFLYIATSDLIPELSKGENGKISIISQLVFMLIGISVIYLVVEFLHGH